MKILLLNIANNVTDFKTVASGETIYIKQVLEQAENEVTIASNKNGEHTTSFEDLETIANFDKVIVIPGALNFFGGVESPTIINNYKLLAQWEKEIFVLQTDARLPFKQLWPSIEKRGWGYKEEDVWVNSPIKVICQSRNIEEVKSQYNKNKNYTDFNEIGFKHFPIDRYAALNAYEFLMENKNKEASYENDFAYYGSFRGGNRAEKMVKYLTGRVAFNFKVHVFGTLKEKQLAKLTDGKLPTFGKKVPMNKTVEEISKSKATIILGEKFYNDAMFTVRVWETMASNSCVLIDEEFDPKHLLFPNDNRRYIRQTNDLIVALDHLVKDDEILKEMLNEQHERFLDLIDFDQYTSDFNKLFE